MEESIKLYNYYLKEVSNTNHKVLTDKEFQQKVIDDKVLIITKNKIITGLLSCVITNQKAYITLNFGDENTKIKALKKLEQKLLDKNIKEIWIHFFNPIKIPFYPVPSKVHPGIQGVPYKTKEYQMYKELGYTDNSLQNTYYLELNEYKENYLKYDSDSIKVEFYDKSLHTGLYEFTCKLNAPHWQNEIMNNDKLITPAPLLVAADKNEVIGFTGPLRKSPSGRGYFGGIGLLAEYQGKKIGTYLFNNLCKSLKDMGADYMTLFTGDNNKAKYLYMKTGFKEVSKQMTMKKVIGSDSCGIQ